MIQQQDYIEKRDCLKYGVYSDEDLNFLMHLN